MSSQTHPQNTRAPQPGAGIGLDDIYFTVFRHKRILVASLCLALFGAAAVFLTSKPIFTSDAKLVVKYVVETIEINPASQGSVNRPGSGASIMTTEVEIVSSLDLAKKVAETVGPEKILARAGGKLGGTSNLMAATRIVSSGIRAESSRLTDVMTLRFTHPDPNVVQPALSALIQAYLTKHKAVRESTAFGTEHYSEQVVQVRKRLAMIEEEIKKILTAENVIDIADAKKSYSAQIEKLKAELSTARAELHARKATLGEDAQSAGNTNYSESNIPAEKLDHYANVLAALDTLKKSERQLILNYLEAHPQVTKTRASIAQLREKKAELEEEFPGLKLSASSVPGVDVTVELAQIRALAAKVGGYENTLTNLQDEAINLLTVEPKIAELKRQQDQEEKNYQYIMASLEKALANESSGSKVTGIDTIQEPTPPQRDNKKMRKMMVAVFGGFLAMGFGISFLIDFVLDRSIKRPSDVRRHMRLPFFLAIPNTCWGGHFQMPKQLLNRFRFKMSENGGISTAAVTNVTPPWDRNHHLRMYSEGLRERLITYFEVNAINHKPKLIGVTSCGEGAGNSTLSTGLAAALSKTGDGNVLLVDMNSNAGETKTFYKGKPHLGQESILRSAFESGIPMPDSSDATNPSESDVDAEAETESLLVPSRFNKFMPELKASDYDYVVFDMPPVTPTSATPRLAGNMDRVLLVIEAEKTQQQTAHEASVLLEDARANAAVVLNKCKRYVPRMLSPQL